MGNKLKKEKKEKNKLFSLTVMIELLKSNEI